MMENITCKPKAKLGKFASAVVIGMSLFAVGSTAQAALMSCPASFTTNPTGKVENTGGTANAAQACQYLTGSAPNNVASISNINTAAFFGFSDWTANTGNLQKEPGNGQSGTWAITGADFITYDYMIVFKDGANTNLIAFHFNEMFASGDWLSPFSNPPFNVNNTKDVSHYTIAQRLAPCNPQIQDCDTPPTDIPEPGSLALLGLGLAAAGFIRRKKHIK